MAQSFPRVPDGQEAMTDLAPSGAVTTYVREASIKGPIWATGRNCFYYLLNCEVLRFFIHNLSLPADAHRTAFPAFFPVFPKKP